MANAGAGTLRVRSVAVSGSYVYATVTTTGLHVVDITNPLSPAIVGNVGTPGYAYSVAVLGDYAYVSDYGIGPTATGAGFYVVDITTPSSPVIVGSIATAGRPYAIALSGDYAYVADEGIGTSYAGSGLYVVDITAPSTPVIVGHADTPSASHDVAISGDYAYVADALSGLQVVDISNPTSPAIVGSVNTPHNALAIVVSGDYAYVADNYSGLAICPSQCGVSTGIAGGKGGNLPGAATIEILSIYPNPFNPAVEVSFENRSTGTVTLEVYDLHGRLLTTELLGNLDVGFHRTTWDGADARGQKTASGVYFLRLVQANAASRTVKGVLLK